MQLFRSQTRSEIIGGLLLTIAAPFGIFGWALILEAFR